MTVLAASAPQTQSKSVSAFEFWPAWVFYIPVVIFWVMMGLRHRSFTLPTAANPRVETGGLCGERKTTILDQAGPEAAAWIAPYIIIRTGEGDYVKAIEAMHIAGISMPIVVKPNIGCNGAGVRLVETEESLKLALNAFHGDIELVLQELIPYEREAGIFYVREPGAMRGRITSLTMKEAPVIVGDGDSTVGTLIFAGERSRHIADVYLPRLEARLDDVLAPGEQLRLVFAGNHCKGSIFTDGSGDITNDLLVRIDSIMQAIPDFHFGRLDVKFDNITALRKGKDFRIIEINGVGSEATHIWDSNTSLWSAYRDQFEHYRLAFKIGAEMRRRGAKSTPFLELLAYWRLQRRLMASYPLND